MPSRAAVINKLLVRTVVWGIFLAALLFVSAGTIAWPEAWVYLALSCGVGVVSAAIIGWDDPALLEERMKPLLQREQKSWDKILISVFFVMWLAQYIVAGLDAVRFRTSDMPLWLEVVGALGILVAICIFHVVMRANTFAAPVVKIQTDRKHQVVSTGPYAYVRHPMYAGAIPLTLGTGLLLGSWYATAVGAAIIALLAWRAVLEEEMLTRELDGYDAYAARVRYRLIPHVW
jgi:protein-S-isoprenylcysteine O-methyltransferase Ste14